MMSAKWQWRLDNAMVVFFGVMFVVGVVATVGIIVWTLCTRCHP